mmetsp:Transcript_93040/g.236669  ORF Transcript_93040/g.236669 Transcript_93040/m.236669 type:complete len:398 (+) Transcript_93040:426-1619(+)
MSWSPRRISAAAAISSLGRCRTWRGTTTARRMSRNASKSGRATQGSIFRRSTRFGRECTRLGCDRPRYPRALVSPRSFCAASPREEETCSSARLSLRRSVSARPKAKCKPRRRLRMLFAASPTVQENYPNTRLPLRRPIFARPSWDRRRWRPRLSRRMLFVPCPRTQETHASARLSLRSSVFARSRSERTRSRPRHAFRSPLAAAQVPMCRTWCGTLTTPSSQRHRHHRRRRSRRPRAASPAAAAEAPSRRRRRRGRHRHRAPAEVRNPCRLGGWSCRWNRSELISRARGMRSRSHASRRGRSSRRWTSSQWSRRHLGVGVGRCPRPHPATWQSARWTPPLPLPTSPSTLASPPLLRRRIVQLFPRRAPKCCPCFVPSPRSSRRRWARRAACPRTPH